MFFIENNNRYNNQMTKQGTQWTDLLLFQVWTTSWSVMLCLCAPLSKKSKRNLTAGGKLLLAAKTVVKRSSINF